MNCLSRVEIQEYIDNELSPATKEEVGMHLSSCEKCREMHLLALKDSLYVNELLSVTIDKSVGQTAPEFHKPRRNLSQNLFIPLGLAVAASVLAFVLLTNRPAIALSEEIPEAEIILREFYEGKDLNKMWHDKDQVLILQDDKGFTFLIN
jgi:anti-sigma factor RsiW